MLLCSVRCHADFVSLSAWQYFSLDNLTNAIYNICNLKYEKGEKMQMENLKQELKELIDRINNEYFLKSIKRILICFIDTRE